MALLAYVLVFHLKQIADRIFYPVDDRFFVIDAVVS